MSNIEIIGCGIMFTGLLLGALTGVVMLLLGCMAVGFITVGAAQVSKLKEARKVPFPPYGY